MPSERPSLAAIDTERVRRRSSLLLLVFGVSLGLVALTAWALVSVVSDRLTDAAIASSVEADESLVGAFSSTVILPAELRADGVDPARVKAIQDKLAALIDRAGGIAHIKIWRPDGTVLYSERPDLRGQSFGLDDDITDAIEGNVVLPKIEPADEGEAATSELPPGTQAPGRTSPDRPDRVGRRRVQRDDDHPPVPQGPDRGRGARASPGRGRIAARPPARRRLRRRDRDRGRPAAPGRRADEAPGLDADLERRLT